MGFQFAVFAMRTVEVTFFVGLIGCAVVVVLSWISVGRDSFSRDTEAELHPGEPQYKARNNTY